MRFPRGIGEFSTQPDDMRGAREENMGNREKKQHYVDTPALRGRYGITPYVRGENSHAGGGLLKVLAGIRLGGGSS